MKLKTVLVNICVFVIMAVMIYKTHQVIHEGEHIFIDPSMPLDYKTKRDLPLHLLSVVPLETLTLSSVCNANMKRASLEQTTTVDSTDDTEK
jgi:hypothetical protein